MLGKQIAEEDAMIHMSNNLPTKYENTVEVLEHRIDDVLDPLAIENICEELSLKYEQIKRNLRIDETNSDKDEVVFVSVYTKFKGRGCGCRTFGHKLGD